MNGECAEVMGNKDKYFVKLCFIKNKKEPMNYLIHLASSICPRELMFFFSNKNK